MKRKFYGIYMKIRYFSQDVEMLFTSMKVDLCQDINREFVISRYLNGTYP